MLSAISPNSPSQLAWRICHAPSNADPGLLNPSHYLGGVPFTSGLNPTTKRGHPPIKINQGLTLFLHNTGASTPSFTRFEVFSPTHRQPRHAASHALEQREDGADAVGGPLAAANLAQDARGVRLSHGSCWKTICLFLHIFAYCTAKSFFLLPFQRQPRSFG